MWLTWLRPEKPITMSKPTFKITRSIRSQQVLNAFVERVLKNLPSNRWVRPSCSTNENTPTYNLLAVLATC
jgi:hypothetical protein